MPWPRGERGSYSQQIESESDEPNNKKAAEAVIGQEKGRNAVKGISLKEKGQNKGSYPSVPSPKSKPSMQETW